MRVLTVYVHPDPKSFCHAILQQFTRGLVDDDTRRGYLERAFKLGKEFSVP